VSEPRPHNSDVKAAAGLFKNIPLLAQIFIFLALAAVSAAAGTLDDWVRLLLAVLFVGVAASLFAEAKQGLASHHAGAGVDEPPPAPAPDSGDVSPHA